MTMTVWFKELGLADYSQKVELFRLAQGHGIAIPPGFVIPSFVFQMFLKHTRLDEHIPYLIESKDSAARKSQQMQGWVRSELIPTELAAELAENLPVLGDSVVVRGPHESIMNLRGAPRLCAAVLEAWAGMFSESWFADAKHKTALPASDVLVQTQVFGRKSAKAKILDANGSVLVNFGLPLSVIEGNADSLTYTQGTLKTAILSKQSALFADPASGEIENQQLDADERGTEVLTAFESEALATHLKMLSMAIGASESVWSLEKDIWYLLAVRHSFSEQQDPQLITTHPDPKLLTVQPPWELLLAELEQKFPESKELSQKLRYQFESLKD